MPPLISAIITVYNGERFVAEAIDSILGQTYGPVEPIVIDDGSTDGTPGICRRFGLRINYVYQENQGLAQARNQGAGQARGEYLSFLDADDLWEPDKLSIQMQAFAADPRLEAVFGHIRQFYEAGVEGAEKAYRYHTEIMPGYHTDTMLIRRSAFDRVGPFADGWKVAVFIDWYARAQELGLQTLMLPDVLAKRRVHGENMGIYDQERAHAEYVRTLKASLDRRRRNQ